jgi:hypothetical protein
LWILAIGTAGIAAAADLPPRKPGLWEITRSPAAPNQPPQLQKICLDAVTDALLYKLGSRVAHQACSKFDITSSSGRVQVDTVCKIGATTTTAHSVTLLTGDTAYHEDASTHFDPPLAGKADAKSSTDGKWMGACPADMKPGDLVIEPSAMLPVPMKMNLRDALKEGE